MNRDSVRHTVAVTLTLAVVCSLLVSLAAVGLRELQESNKERSKKKNILIAAGLFQKGMDVDRAFDQKVRVRLVDLDAGGFAAESVADPATYDQKSAARDPGASKPPEPAADHAGIGRRENYSQVYLIEQGGQLDQMVLPVYGRGLYSTLYGLIAVDADGKTIRGITFYEHGETPGLGGEIENSKWTAKWIGKKLFDDDGSVAIEIVKGAVPRSDPEADYAIDGISGATMTSKGVTGMLLFWFGDDGFGPFLKKSEF